MPAEVLSYFFKHEDMGLKLRFQIVLQCAHFLKGLKVSCGITVSSAMYDGLASVLKGTGISFKKLSETDGKCLVLFYRREVLAQYLNRVGIRSFISTFGYSQMKLEEMLDLLSVRILARSAKNQEFPHEIGIFLGYPIEDVRGFIENAGHGYLLLGYWKVYSNPARARLIFNEFDQARVWAVNEFLTGKSIQDIARNQEVSEWIYQ
ncbi:DUF3793 family protein [Luxibacter massiliensis]|uniref:DUF3793 family protein n=1 Tax=Luxibacter massiliensis TaxID=2219695 RepID=UPI000F047AB7|nr:DUF3793 family protein [Luxibacter massiliensis]